MLKNKLFLDGFETKDVSLRWIDGSPVQVNSKLHISNFILEAFDASYCDKATRCKYRNFVIIFIGCEKKIYCTHHGNTSDECPSSKEIYDYIQIRYLPLICLSTKCLHDYFWILFIFEEFICCVLIIFCDNVFCSNNIRNIIESINQSLNTCYRWIARFEDLYATISWLMWKLCLWW